MDPLQLVGYLKERRDGEMSLGVWRDQCRGGGYVSVFKGRTLAVSRMQGNAGGAL